MQYALTIAFSAVDYVTGVLKAVKNKNFNSTVMRKGIFNKAGLIIILLLGSMIDFTIQYIDIGFQSPVGSLFCGAIVIMECSSIFENACALNDKIANSKIAEFFVKAKEVKKTDDEAR